MSGKVVKVKREIMEACMTCPLCHKLLKEATTISLCLHTFCRKCIYEKISDEEMNCCPVCNIDLGCMPEEKLRPDHNLQDIRAKIFPFKRRKTQAPEVIPLISLPTKRKERSLSSLVVSAPKVPNLQIQTGQTGRRSKAAARKVAALRVCNFSSPESPEDHPISSGSPESPIKITQNKRQGSSVAPPSIERWHDDDDDAEDDVKKIERKVDLWTPLNCLVEAANRTKPFKTNSQGPSYGKSELSNDPKYEGHSPETKPKVELLNGHDKVYMPKLNNKEHDEDMMVQNKSGTNSLSALVKHRRLTARKRTALSEERSASTQFMLDTTRAKRDRRNHPIWFSLVASEDQKGDASLPQISACYLRIKDGKMPVSLIQKYLVKKLDLANEAEVEIMCCGEPLLPTLQLHNIVDLWFRKASTSRKVLASVGSSAKDFVTVLSYSRKIRTS